MVNHGMKPGTSIRTGIHPTNRTQVTGLWTGGNSYPQPGDNGEKESLTLNRGDSRTRFLVASREQFGQSGAIPDFHSTTESIILIQYICFF